MGVLCKYGNENAQCIAIPLLEPHAKLDLAHRAVFAIVGTRQASVETNCRSGNHRRQGKKRGLWPRWPTWAVMYPGLIGGDNGIFTTRRLPALLIARSDGATLSPLGRVDLARGRRDRPCLQGLQRRYWHMTSPSAW